MEASRQIPRVEKPALNFVLLFLIGVSGCVAVILSSLTPSESGSAVLFGYSLPRLVVSIITILTSGLFLTTAFLELRQSDGWVRRAAKVRAVIASPARLFTVIVLLFILFLLLSALLLIAASPVSIELTLLNTLMSHFGSLLIWGELTILLLGLLVFINTHSVTDWRSFFSPLRLSILFSILIGVYAASLRVYMTYTWDIRMRGMEKYIFLPALVFVIWGILDRYYSASPWYNTALGWIRFLAIGAVTYTITIHTAQWMEWSTTPSKAYWPELANAFLQGRLYLTNPASTHDLTFFNGNWYVPLPPLPGIVLMPVVALWGQEINTVQTTILVGVVNVLLVFALLEEAARLGLIRTNRMTHLLITALFAFGTSHWWLAMMGRVWFMSQLMALTCVLAATLLTLRRASPWIVGIFMGLALLARPNIFPLFIFLVGLAVYRMETPGSRFDFKRSLAWAIPTAVPMVLAAGALLVYNQLRFQDFFDFGYVTINSADWIMQLVRKYGMFNVHFIPTNLHMMLLKLPQVRFNEGCFLFSPTREGYSIFAMTPALLYVFRPKTRNWWTIGAWASIILTVALLLLYHNNGSWQLGYRYLMDFIVPVILLLAAGLGARTSRLFSILTIFSILITGASIIWWFEKWWC